MTYSGASSTGFNIGSYDRQRFTGTKIVKSASELIAIVDKGVGLMRLNQKSRLDIRMLVPIHLINEIKDKLSTFKGIEIAILQLGNGLCEAQICFNDESRRLDSTIVNSIKTRVLEASKVSESNAVDGNSVLAEILSNGYSVARSGFSASEIHTLWQPFGYSEDECLEFAQVSNENSSNQQIWGLRDANSELLSLLLITKDTYAFETTEWATREDARGQGLMNSLLQVAHWSFFERSPNLALYAHCVHDGSMKTGLRNGGWVDENNDLLTNHVTISSFSPDSHNSDLSIFEDSEYLRTFALVQFAQPDLDENLVRQIISNN